MEVHSFMYSSYSLSAQNHQCSSILSVHCTHVPTCRYRLSGYSIGAHTGKRTNNLSKKCCAKRNKKPLLHMNTALHTGLSSTLLLIARPFYHIGYHPYQGPDPPPVTISCNLSVCHTCTELSCCAQKLAILALL